MRISSWQINDDLHISGAFIQDPYYNITHNIEFSNMILNYAICYFIIVEFEPTITYSVNIIIFGNICYKINR